MPRWASPTLALPPTSTTPPKHIRHPALGTESRRFPAGEDPSRACGRDGQTDGERSGRETCSSPSLVRQSLASLCGERGGGTPKTAQVGSGTKLDLLTLLPISTKPAMSRGCLWSLAKSTIPRPLSHLAQLCPAPAHCGLLGGAILRKTSIYS